MIERLVLVGATGDLVGRYLLPALARLRAAGGLPDGLDVLGAAVEHHDDSGFRRHAAAQLDEHAGDLPVEARDALVRTLRYRPVDVTDTTSVAGVVHDVARGRHGPTAVYLALPPGLFAATVTNLDAAGLPAGSRVALEKPFGEDLAGAQQLNGLLARLAGGAGEDAVYRVDHFLGMATVQNALGLRFGNHVLGSLWHGDHVAQIEIVWEERLSLEDRAAYYDTAGQLKDMIQSHLLQVLSLVAMEPPATLTAADLRDRKLDALRAIRPITPEDALACTRRARYAAGTVDNRPVPAYVDEAGVDPARRTETFAEVVLHLDAARWRGTPVVLRTGKSLGRDRMEVVVHFRPAGPTPFAAGEPPPVPNELHIGLATPEDITLVLTGAEAGSPPRPVPLALDASPPLDRLGAYARVLRDILDGDSTLSVGSDEAEQAWRIVTPVLQAWADDRVPLDEYPAGSTGPAPLVPPPADRPTA